MYYFPEETPSFKKNQLLQMLNISYLIPQRDTLFYCFILNLLSGNETDKKCLRFTDSLINLKNANNVFKAVSLIVSHAYLSYHYTKSITNY